MMNNRIETKSFYFRKVSSKTDDKKKLHNLKNFVYRMKSFQNFSTIVFQNLLKVFIFDAKIKMIKLFDFQKLECQKAEFSRQK